MTNVAEILSELERRGVTAAVEGDTLELRPGSALDEDLLARLREHKPEILGVLLRRRPHSCASSCYEIEPGRWIHHSWEGCKTIAPAPAPLRVEGQCWHCQGLKACNCIVCCDARTDGPGQCITCKGTGRIWAWVQ